MYVPGGSYSAGSALTGRMAGDVGQLCGRLRTEIEQGDEFRDNPAARAALAVSGADRSTRTTDTGTATATANVTNHCWQDSPEGSRFRSPIITAVSVSPSYSITDGLQRCEALLGSRLLQRCKEHWLQSHPDDESLLRGHDAAGFERCV